MSVSTYQKLKHSVSSVNERRWHMGLPDMMTPAQFKEYYARDPEVARLAVAKVAEKSRLG